MFRLHADIRRAGISFCSTASLSTSLSSFTLNFLFLAIHLFSASHTFFFFADWYRYMFVFCQRSWGEKNAICLVYLWRTYVHAKGKKRWQNDTKWNWFIIILYQDIAADRWWMCVRMNNNNRKTNKWQSFHFLLLLLLLFQWLFVLLSMCSLLFDFSTTTFKCSQSIYILPSPRYIVWLLSISIGKK